jgi:pimeloyl-ACP methyl ester carboxylesterase
VEREIQGVAGILRLDDDGVGPAIVGLHGLSATRRYVVMGSRVLERSGYRVILYDARGHGSSDPPPSDDYSYPSLAGDLRALLDALELDRAVLVGASMGAHTALRFALDNPERVAALALVTPGYDPDRFDAALAHWDALSLALRERGIDGFLEAYDFERVPSAWRETVATVIRQRLALHAHPLAVADALAAVPRSRPFDPEHPFALAERYARAIPGSALIVEDEGRSPIAWQGGQLSRSVEQLARGLAQ